MNTEDISRSTTGLYALLPVLFIALLTSDVTFAQVPQDDTPLPIRVFLDDQLLTETSNPAAAVASEVLEPQLTSEVMDLHLSVDGNEIERHLSVAVFQKADTSLSVAERRELEFRADWNYGSFVSRGEIRIYEADKFGRGAPLKILPLKKNRIAVWKRPMKGAEKHAFALRLYGNSGGFDQSEPVIIEEETRDYTKSSDWRERKIKDTGYSDTGIELFGAQLKLELTQVPAGHTVIVNKHQVFERNGEAEIQLVLPPGEHMVRVQVKDANGDGVSFERKAIVPMNNFFFAGLGDLSIGARTGRDFADYVDTTQTTGEIDLFDSIGIEGQASMFLKGRILGKYLITAALDTGERDLEEFGEVLKEIVARDPNAIITQIDPDQTYSIYGDKSSLGDEAPTERLFVKIQREENHLLWGSFSISIRGNSFATIERSVYGGELKHTQQIQTDIGTAYIDTTAFALPPGQLQQRDKLPGNDGFIYGLTQGNIIKGTEIVRITVEDSLSNIVLEEQDLYRGLDFDIDYLQGQIVLTSPLPEFQEDGSAVASQNPVYLTVIYEYQPVDAVANSLVIGGRSALTVGDFLSVGVTALVDGSSSVEQTMYGLDAQANLGQQSFVKAQIAQTEKLGSGEILSGGSSGLGTNAQTTKARAYRGEFKADFYDFGLEKIEGSVSGSYQHKDDGFAGPGQLAYSDEDVYSTDINLPLMQGRLMIDGRLNGRIDNSSSSSSRDISVDASYEVNEKINAGLGLQHLSDTRFSWDTGEIESTDRTDIGATIDYRLNEKIKLGVFAETSLAASPETLKRTQVGVKGEYQINDKLFLGGKLSSGTNTLEGEVELAYTNEARERTYVSYESAVEPEGGFSLTAPTGPRKGLLKWGTRKGLEGGVMISTEGRLGHGKREADYYELDQFGEYQLDQFGEKILVQSSEANGVQSYSQSASIDFTPNDKWQLGLNGELSLRRNRIEDFATGEWTKQTYIERSSLRGSFSYLGDKLDTSGSIEFRRQGTRDTLETSGSISLDFDPNWRMYSKLNTVSTTSSGVSTSNFFKADVGAAYRPVDNDRFSSVFNYKAFYDLPDGSDASDSNNFSAAEYKQRSHIFSLDTSYAFTPNLTLGGKYGIKWGQVTSSRANNDWDSSTVHLLVGRADFNFAKKWDAVLEGRLMNLTEGNSTRTGALAAIYRHFGNNLKAGVGYNFSSVSDDLTNVNASSVGYFFNVISKF